VWGWRACWVGFPARTGAGEPVGSRVSFGGVGVLCVWVVVREVCGLLVLALAPCDRIATAREAGWPSHDVEPYPASLDVRTASRERKGKPANRARGCSVRVASAFHPRSGSFWGWVWVAPLVGRLYAPKDGVQPQGRGSSISRP